MTSPNARDTTARPPDLWREGEHTAVEILGLGQSSWWQIYCVCGSLIPFRTREEMYQRFHAHASRPARTCSASLPDDGHWPTCEFCGSRESEIGPAWRRKSDPLYSTVKLLHGFVCEPCYLTLGFAQRSCPIRRSDDPAELKTRAAVETTIAQQERDNQAKASAALALLNEGFSEPLDIIARETGQDWGGRTFLCDIIIPEFRELLHPFRCALAYHSTRAAFSEREANKHLRQSREATSVTFGGETPFEDPDFFERLIAVGEEERHRAVTTRSVEP